MEVGGQRNFAPPPDMAGKEAGLKAGPLVMLVATATPQGVTMGMVTVTKP